MNNGFADRESLNPLLAPFRADLAAWNSPHFFGVILKEGAVQFTAETVDKELFQSKDILFWEKRTLHVAETNFESAKKTELHQCVEVELDGIIKEPTQIINS